MNTSESGFTRGEIIGVGIIFLLIAAFSLPNFIVAERRGRDAQRKNDIGTIDNAVKQFKTDFSYYPLSDSEGRIVACKNALSPSPCEWGVDKLADLADPSYPPYLNIIPRDPDWRKGVSYRYLSNGRRYQILAHLEGKDEDEYKPEVEARGIDCGGVICNTGLSAEIPLDKSIEQHEYELQLEEERLRKEGL